MKIPSKKQAVLELILAGAIWGSGFIVTKDILLSFGPLTLSVFRFLLSIFVIYPLIIWVPNFRTEKPKKLFHSAIIPGVCLAALMTLQAWGLKYTTATRSGFITTLYIVMVPLFEVFLLKKRMKYEHILWVALALLGTALICDFEGGNWNIGDVLTFLCAIAAALHIIAIARVSAKVDSAMAFNVYQNIVCAAVTIVVWIFVPEPIGKVTTSALFGVVYLAFAATGLAFMLQIRAQQVLSASSASLLFLLESPFAALFGFIFLGEVMALNQWIGAVLILVSAVLCVRRSL